jgi:hypothetical protein
MLRRKNVIHHRFQACGDKEWIIERENHDGGTPNSCLANNLRADPREVVAPCVNARVKETRQFSGQRINPSDVRALMTVAMVTGECKVLRRGPAAVLTCDDVIEWKAEPIETLRHQAILTRLARAGTNIDL